MDDDLAISRLKQILSIYYESNQTSEINSDFVRESHRECGKGFVYADISDVINIKASHLNNLDKHLKQLKHFWFNANEYGTIRDLSTQEKVKELLEEYDPSEEYILILSAKDDVDSKSRYILGIIPLLEKLVLPRKLSSQQIRKRLKRMKQAGKKTIKIDQNNPDFMGDNREKWLKEIEQMNEQEKVDILVLED